MTSYDFPISIAIDDYTTADMADFNMEELSLADSIKEFKEEGFIPSLSHLLKMAILMSTMILAGMILLLQKKYAPHLVKYTNQISN